VCKWGTSIRVWVKIPADLACSGESYWKDAQIDACIAPLVRALQEGGIDMRGSCCGHGRVDGHIDFQDGRGLVVLSPERNAEYLAGSPRALPPWASACVEQVLRARFPFFS
jgi:hypothetical protein